MLRRTGDMNRTRRVILGVVSLVIILVAAVWVGAVVTACGSGSTTETGASTAAGSGELSVAGFGGAYGDAERASYFDPYQQQTGVKVKVLPAEASLSQVELQVKSGKVLWDLVDLAGPDAVRGMTDGLLEKVDYSIVPKDALAPDAGVEGGVATSIWIEGIGYMKKNYSTPPTWQDFFNTQKYPGKRTMEKYIQDGTLEYALLGSGVPKESLYPLDINKATSSLDSLGSNVVFVDSLAQASQLLAAGDATMIQTGSGRILALQNAGIEVGFNPVGMTAVTYLCIPKGAPHAQEAMKFLAWMAGYEKGSTTMGNMTGYAGPNAVGNTKVTGPGAALLPTNENIQKLSFPQDVEWWAQNADEAQSAFEQFLVSQ
jgi:putative spermidine/putrescine transport system substrate-binding protein